MQRHMKIYKISRDSLFMRLRIYFIDPFNGYNNLISTLIASMDKKHKNCIKYQIQRK